MAKYKVGDIIEGIVTGIENYGIFVSLNDGYSGLIHISEISNAYVKDPKDFAKIGESIEAKIIEINDDTKEVRLSIKKLNDKFQEIGSGFDLLKENLDKWIEEKL